MRPLVIDLYCGLGGWSEGFLAEGYDCIGFDVERHDYGSGGYPGQLVLQDVLTLHGSQFRDAACIVASPPCQAYSYMAMPWTRAKKIAAEIRSDPEKRKELTALFDACFRIQREASAAAGRHVPMVVENVKGAQPWVGRAKANFGSFYLWGDVEMIGWRIVRSTGWQESPTLKSPRRTGGKQNPDGTGHGQGSWFAVADSKNRGVGRKVTMNFHEFEEAGQPGRSFRSAAVAEVGQKVAAYSDPRRNGGRGVHLTNPHENAAGIKQPGHSGRAWFADPDVAGHYSSKSVSRKAASAQIAKIPFPLAVHIARCFKPNTQSREAKHMPLLAEAAR